MGYEKRIWVNNQTKLNATNLNHIENGLENLSNDLDTTAERITEIYNKVSAAELAATTAAANAIKAETLASSANVIAERSLEKVESKQDILVSGTTIKTVDNKSLLGEGNIDLGLDNYYTKEDIDTFLNDVEKINYEELTGVSLNNVIDSGTYKITEGEDTPTDSKNGILIVHNLGVNSVEQQWYSNKVLAIRILSLEEGITSDSNLIEANTETTTSNSWTIYVIREHASEIKFDDTEAALGVKTVQDAIDQLKIEGASKDYVDNTYVDFNFTADDNSNAINLTMTTIGGETKQMSVVRDNVDLSNYYNKSEVETLIDSKINTAVNDILNEEY